MNGDHSTRDHALLSASSAHRWLYCTAAPLLEAEFPDSTSEAAREGTLAHELAEAKLLNFIDPKKYSKTVLTKRRKELMQDPLWDDEMEEYTDIYLDYIKGVVSATLPSGNVTIKAETRLDLSDYIPCGFGTADCIIINRESIHVIDFKYGKNPSGRVYASGNPQLMLYALGALKRFKLLKDFQYAEISIVQPRLPDGICSCGLDIKKLYEFGDQVRQKAEEALSGNGVFSPEIGRCKYCRARKTCRARAISNITAADPGLKRPPLLTDEEVGEYLSLAKDIASWAEDLKDYALEACLSGNEIPGWKAVEGRGVRAWTDADAAFETIKASGIPEEMLYEKKPLTLAAVEKLMGKKAFAETAGSFIEKTTGKPTLVMENDKRTAITNKITAEEAFKED